MGCPYKKQEYCPLYHTTHLIMRCGLHKSNKNIQEKIILKLEPKRHLKQFLQLTAMVPRVVYRSLGIPWEIRRTLQGLTTGMCHANFLSTKITRKSVFYLTEKMNCETP